MIMLVGDSSDIVIILVENVQQYIGLAITENDWPTVINRDSGVLLENNWTKNNLIVLQ